MQLIYNKLLISKIVFGISLLIIISGLSVKGSAQLFGNNRAANKLILEFSILIVFAFCF